MKFDDAVGNSRTYQFNLSFDTDDVSCSTLSGVVWNSQSMIFASNQTWLFRCVDSSSGIREIYSRTSSQNKLAWNLSSGNIWEAPQINDTSFEIFMIDNVGNTLEFQIAALFDSTSPTINLTGVGIDFSLSELAARSDGAFRAECHDDIFDDCELRLSVWYLNSNASIFNLSGLNSVQGNLPSVNQDTQVRIVVQATDGFGHSRFATVLMDIDDTSPNYTVQPYTSWGTMLDQGIVSYDSEIRFIEMDDDVNAFSGPLLLECISPSYASFEQEYTPYLKLSDFNLSGCIKLAMTASLSDHVGNTEVKYQEFLIDFQIPRVEYILDDSCSMIFASHVDIKPDCQISIRIHDDSSTQLNGDFTISVSELNSSGQGNSLTESPINRLTNRTLEEYNNKAVLISVRGEDRVGNIIEANSIRLLVSDQIVPVWSGIICFENNDCDISQPILAAPVGAQIGVNSPANRAPLVSTKFDFTNVHRNFTFEDAFSSNSLPEGNYQLRINFTDAIGRTMKSIASSDFTYDTSAPQIGLLNSRSVGLLNETTILACDKCVLAWEVEDISLVNSITNHRTESRDSNVYEISTANFGENSVVISATDIFGRTSELEIQTVGLIGTKIAFNSSLQEYANVFVQCVELESTSSVREISCFWTRKSPVVESIPVFIDIDIQLEELRNVQLIITAGGAGTQVLSLGSGELYLPNLYSYNPSVTMQLKDEFSEESFFRIELIEHQQAWDSLDFYEPNLHEDELKSSFDILLSPPANEGSYILFERGFYDVKDVMGCSTFYQFKQRDNLPNLELNLENCRIEPGGINFLQNGSMFVSVTIDHSAIYAEEVRIDWRRAPLFNLESLSLRLNYSDEFGVNVTSIPGDLKIGPIEIQRSLDILPVYNASASSYCPLGKQNQDTDGFLQSDITSPLYACQELISDENGIEYTAWVIEFGVSRNQVIFICKETFFPRGWNFEGALGDECFMATNSAELVDGFFDHVEITPFIVDGSLYPRISNQTGVEFSFIDNGELREVIGRAITLENCSSMASCEIKYVVQNVVVSSQLKPNEAIENSQSLMKNSEIFTSSTFYSILFYGTIFLFFGALAIFAYNLHRRSVESLSHSTRQFTDPPPIPD